ncbi:MAG: tetratricopeptide repeat protein [Saprospiraceae bacterium]|nr:tetratricopeptide repeat protein [Saprospiraceae bacterium]
MQHAKIIEENNLIEFHNSWTGEESVYLNGQLVSKKSSIMGISHSFETNQSGELIRYILTSKVSNELQVKLDLIRNGIIIQKDIAINYGNLPKKPEQEFKENGKSHLRHYDLQEALEEFKKAAKINPNDPEVHFHLACVYSLQEKVKEGFAALKNSVENNLVNKEDILSHDMLAYLRIQPAFEGFMNSGFIEYNLSETTG